MLFHCQKALEIRIKSLGGAHGPTRKNKIATVLEQQGKINEALKVYEEALEKMIQAVGPSHVSVAKTKRILGQITQLLRTTRRRGPGETVLPRSLCHQRKSLGADHPNTRGLAQFV